MRRAPLQNISLERRRANRRLSTGQLLNLLRREAPRFFEIAEVVGTWVWIHFDQRQPHIVTGHLSELGFHWNKRRLTWQHPCGSLSVRSDRDPREKYRSYYPADNRRA